MRRLLIALALWARPVADPLGFLAAARSWEVPAAHGRCDVWHGGLRHDVRAWVDADRFHLAWMGPLGAPRAVLRGDGERLHLTVGPDVILADEAGAVLAETGWPDLRDVTGLLVGRLPGSRVVGVALLEEGRRIVRQEASVAVVEGDRLTAIAWSGARGVRGSLGRTGDGLPTHLTVEPLGIEARCTWREGVPPALAFTMETSRAVPVERLGRRLALELAMLAARRD